MDNRSPSSTSDEDITGSVQFLVGQIHADVKQLLDRTNKYDTRLQKVEKRQWMTIGGAALFCTLYKSSALATVVGSVLGLK